MLELRRVRAESYASNQKRRKTSNEGNFKNYYCMRKDIAGVNGDYRIQAITNWLGNNVENLPKTLLDIGCNDGTATIQFLQYLSESLQLAIGIDIDANLIDRARENLKTSAFLRDLGTCMSRFTARYPRKRINLFEKATTEIRFEVIDIASLIPPNLPQFELITILSICKWIHFNHGDKGLKRFFARIAKNLAPNGVLIIEIQPWKSYKEIRKYSHKNQNQNLSLKFLQIVPEDFSWILTNEFGLQGPFSIIERGQNGFIRSIEAYIQPKILSSTFQSNRDKYLFNDVDSIPWVARDHKTCY